MSLDDISENVAREIQGTAFDEIDALEKHISKLAHDYERRISALELFTVTLCDVIAKSPAMDAHTRQSAAAIKLTLERTKS